jgi:hypothetical protein
MATYTPRKLPAVLTTQWISDELAEIETKHNSHDPEDFPEKCVPLRALKYQYSQWCTVLQHDGICSGALDQFYLPILSTCVLTAYSITAHASAGTCPFGILSSVTGTYLVGPTAFASTYATSSTTLYPGDNVQVLIDTSSAGASVTKMVSTFWFKSKHVV